MLNRGFGGSHMSDLLFYLEELILQYKPRKVFIYEGDNDLFDRKDTVENLKEAQEIVEKINKEFPKTSIIFISAKPSISRWNFRNEYLKFNNELKNFTN